MTQRFDAETFRLEDEHPMFLLEANAGTGKTYSIQKLVEKFIGDGIAEISQFLVVTYTKAAAGELGSRILRALDEAEEAAERAGDAVLRERFHRANVSFDEASISTIHSFCQRALAEFAFESGTPFEAELVEGEDTVLREFVHDFCQKGVAAGFLPCARMGDVDACVKLAELLLKARREDLLPAVPERPPARECPDAPESDARFLFAAGRLWDALHDPVNGFGARKERLQQLDFDDLVNRLAEALRDPDGALAAHLRARYKIAILDEFQDTDPAQYRIFKTLFDRLGHRLFLIGDPKQAIYEFRGGDVHTYRRARQDVEQAAPGHVYSLQNNFRSEPGIIAAVNALFEKPGALFDQGGYVPSRYGPETLPADRREETFLLRDGRTLDAPIQVHWHPGGKDGKALAKANAEELFLDEAAETVAHGLNDAALRLETRSRAKTEQRRLRPEDFAVLVNTNGQCAEMKRKLNARGIPAVIYKGENVYASETARDLWFILAAILDTGTPRLVRAALLTPWCAKTCGEVVADETGEAVERLAAIHAVAGDWRARGIAFAVDRFMSVVDGYANIAKRPDGERHLANLRQLVELLGAEEQGEGLQPEAVLRRLAENRFRKTCAETEEERLETDARSVQVMTVHKSKGLQFRVVVCPAFALSDDAKPREKPFLAYPPDGAPGENRTLVLLPEAEEAQPCRRNARNDGFAEAVRKFYVALTRAESACVLILGNVSVSRKFQRAQNYLFGLHRSLADSAPAIPEMASAFPPPDLPGWVTLPFIDGPGETYAPEAPSPPALAAAAFGGSPVENRFAVLSYSSMTDHGRKRAEREEETEREDASDTPETDAADGELPGGADFGSAVHAVFEHLDYREFDTPDEKRLARLRRMVKGCLRTFGLLPPDDAECAEARVAGTADLVLQTLGAQLPVAPSFRFSSLARGATRREWTFFFPTGGLVKLRKRFASLGVPVKQAEGVVENGFLNGSIDLFFKGPDGKYYFADWKTNRLADYGQKTLAATMAETGYLLQSAIYSAAIYRQLRRVFDGETAVERFGGGFYCFVRGMRAESSDGIFRIPPADLPALNALFDD